MLALTETGAMGDTTVLSFTRADSDYLLVPDFTWNPQHGTIEFWFSPKDTAGSGQWNTRFDLLTGQSTGGANRFLLYREATANLRFLYVNSANSGFHVNINTTGWQGTEFYHFALHFSDGDNDGVIRVFTNGVEVGSTVVEGAMGSHNQINLMRDVGNQNYTDGRLADVRLWNTLRTEQEIQDHMHVRLTGQESGLVGYWPLSEGSGSTAGDLSPSGKNGTIYGAEWTTAGNLNLATSEAGYVPSAPLTLADVETGSTAFTNDETVELAGFPIPEGYNHFQLTTGGEVSALGETWTFTNAVPGTYSFASPTADTNLVLYAWFTNTSEVVTLRRARGDIFYTDVAPMPAVRAPFSLVRGTGQPVVIDPALVNSGSTGGVADGKTMTIDSLSLTYESGPGEDLTPGDPWVTVDTDGEHVLTLTVVNEAGNSAVSAPVTVTVSTYTGTMTWNGSVNNNWFEPFNWTPNGIPFEGATVQLSSGTIRLTGETARVGSFTQTGGTLDMRTWEAALVADDVTFSGGTLTHPVQTAVTPTGGVWVPDNRVRIVCSNFTATATINVAARGFRGNYLVTMSPGYGPGGGSSMRGAGYGGHGGGSDAGFGLTYGIAEDPTLWPGSGGGSRDGVPGRRGGNGGGLFVLEASGHVVLNGMINADGEATPEASWGGGGGSGGGVFIRCATIAATNAAIYARGGNGGGFAGGSGGGGRIAIEITDEPAQSALPAPQLLLGARPGLVSGPNWASTDLGDYGTVHINSRFLMPLIMTGFYAYFHGPGATQWSGESLTLSNSWVRIENHQKLEVDGDIRIVNSALLGLRETHAGGDVTITDSSTLSFHGFPTTQFASHLTAPVMIDGEFHIGAGCTVFVHSDPTTGGSPYFEVDRLYLASTATINADQRGYAGGPVTAGGYGPGATTDGRGGASHGGTGGRHPLYGGTIYGVAENPAEPGSGGAGRTASTYGRAGGGLIHITAADTMALHGTVTANGGAAASNIGASSGGAIYLWADIFLPAEGTISAVGGAGTGSGSAALGGGGGGRIARLFRGDGFTGNRLRAGGANEFPGLEGSLHEGYYDDFVTLTIEGHPARRGQPTPLDYGNHGIIEGTVVNNSVTSPTVGVDGVRYRCLGWHFEDANGVTDSGTGTAFSGTINTNATLTWFWTNEYYLATSAAVGGSLQTDRTGWYTEAETTSLTPVADSGRTFTQWVGDYAPASLTTVPLPILMDAPRTIRANFGVVGGTAKTWAGGTGDWMNPDGWAPAGVPAPDDTVAITNGAVTLNVEILGIAALTVRAPGTLTVIDTDLSVAGSMVLDGSGLRATFTRSDLTVGGHLELMHAGDLRVNSGLAPVGDYGTKVEVKGNLTIGTGSWIFPHSALYENGSVFFPVGNLYVDSGGGFNADHRGYRGGLAPQDGGPTVGWGPGRGNLSRGGGYGGPGGGASGSYGQVYGSEEHPTEPGSGGGGDGGNPWRAGGYGGGLIWVEAADRIVLDGTMTANGQIGQGDSATGGGSGGGIYLRCRRFEGSGILRANGGSGHGGTTGTSGGGGRIAVWRTSHTFTGPEPSVSVGTPPGSPPAGEGTVFWGDIPPRGKLFIIR